MAPKFDFSNNGLTELEKYLATRSYIEGYNFTKADTSVFTSLPSVPCKSGHPNVYRWYLHIAALSGIPAVIATCPSGGDGAKTAKPAVRQQAPKKPVQAADDDDVDLFGDDDEEAAAPKEEVSRAEKIAAAKKEKEAKEKANKKKDRSQIVFEVKPVDTDVDLDALYTKIKAEISKQGLQWGEGYNKQPVAYGIFKLVISCVVNDEEVSVDDIVEQIEAMEDHVQSVDIASFNKL